MDRYKYPSTPVLPWSPGSKRNNEFDVKNFEGKEVIVTEKLDGENTTMYRDYIHARSIDGRDHPSRSWVKAFHAQIRYKIPDGWRVCGENVFAKHTLPYKNLESYFYAFIIWDHMNMSLNLEDFINTTKFLDIPTPDTLYYGLWDEQLIRDIAINRETTEGYVIRNAEDFHFDDFDKNVAKWVRPNHVQTDEHWMWKDVVPNKLSLE